jgi:probable F420-dependent oxidoreductase
VKFGVWLPAIHPFSTPEVLTATAGELESRRINSVWVGEHVVNLDDYASSYPYSPDGKMPATPENGVLEPLTVLTYLAAHTSTVRLGTGVSLLGQRNPVYTAKETAAVDWLSGGRLEYGIGVGWCREEQELVGVPWERRGARVDEAVGVLRALWETDPSEYSGEFFQIPPCHMHPKPIQARVPIVVGGESPAALRRVAKLGDAWFTFNRLPEDLAEPLAELDVLLAERGRSRSEVQIYACSYFQELTPERAEQYAAAGVDQLVSLVFPMTVDTAADSFDAIEPIRQRVASL